MDNIDKHLRGQVFEALVKGLFSMAVVSGLAYWMLYLLFAD